MKKLLISVLFLPLMACQGFKNDFSMVQDASLKHNDTFQTYLKDESFRVSNIPYLKGSIKKFDPVLSQQVEIKSVGTLEDICLSLESLFPSISFYTDMDARRYYASIEYKGTLEETLNNISNKTGVFWEYDENEKKVLFSEFITKTYLINTSSSKVDAKSVLTNSSEDSASDGGGSTKTSQETEITAEYDVIEEMKETITEFLSSDGKMNVNPAAGTITVKDKYFAIQNIDNAVKEMNKLFGQQVAISVKVYAITLNDGYDIGLNLQAVFDDGTSSFVGGGEAMSSALGNITAGIIKSSEDDTNPNKLGGSSLSVQALKKLGNVSLVNQGSGITTHNQPFALQSTRTETYLKSISSSTSEYGQDIMMEPGEVTEGFSMLFTPSIRGKQVVLEYNLSLITLEGIENFTSNQNVIQLPKLSTKAFNQHAVMTMGETLVIGAFLSENITNSDSIGLFGFTKADSKQKTLIVITVDLDNAGLPVLIQ